MCACSRTSARMRLGVPPSARVVVFVGALTRAKGVATLLRAFAQVCGSRRDTLLLVVGDGPLLKTLRAYAQSKCPSSSVVFAGAIPHENVGVYLSAADVFALPSAAEGFPMSVAEAMAIGLPVVCTGVGALPDIVRDGVNGHLVRAGDANALGDAFSSLLDNPGVVAEMGRKNRAWARRHSWDDVAERFAGVCAEVIVRRAETTESPSERFDKYGIHA